MCHHVPLCVCLWLVLEWLPCGLCSHPIGPYYHIYVMQILSCALLLSFAILGNAIWWFLLCCRHGLVASLSQSTLDVSALMQVQPTITAQPRKADCEPMMLEVTRKAWKTPLNRSSMVTMRHHNTRPCIPTAQYGRSLDNHWNGWGHCEYY